MNTLSATPMINISEVLGLIGVLVLSTGLHRGS